MSKARRRKSHRPAAPSLPPQAASTSSAPPSSSAKRRKRRRAPSAERRTPPPAPRGAGRPLFRVALALGFSLVVCLGSLWAWSVSPSTGAGTPFVLEVPEHPSLPDVTELLVARGALASPRLFRAYVALLHPGFELVPGEHLLSDRSSARDLALRLGHSASRASQRVTLPEGLNSVQVGQRLERAEVCSLAALRRAVTDGALLRELGIGSPSAEGYLFPASYGLLVDSDAREVVRVLAAETRKRLQKADAAHPARRDELKAQFGFGELEILTLASLIEKEARVDEERPLIASVFFNRLRDPDFRPARMLQSDPTASYGCVIAAERIPSCASFHGSVTPALLRDPANPYNTYRHAGLPPGPIANPGDASIEAVFSPARSDFLYFVAKGAGRHAFSRTFAEHREALETPH